MTVQNFEHDRSAYDRPNQKWICGWATDGGGCRLGPDVRGRCRTTHECQPVRNGARWMCMRPTIAGGRCEAGPLPDGTCCRAILECQPVRSVRSKRGAMVSGFAVLTIGFLVVLIGGPWRGAFVSPGQLSTTHAQLEDDCSRCHSAADAGFVGVLQASLQPPAAQTESGNCLQCHNIGASYGSPHSLPRHALDVLVQKAHGREQDPSIPLRASLGAAVTPNLAPSDEIACAVCHAEHQGRRFDLKRMDSMSCQSCHQQKFHSFSRGHPQFSVEYPTTRRTRIAFNHSTHYSLHFKDESWAGDCLSCHQPDSNGARMVLGGFETSCGSCHHHRRQIAGAGLSEPSVLVFGIPAVDLETLDAHGLWIGDAPWPADANIGDEMVLSPFMRLLLWSDPAVARDLTLLDETDGSLLDLSDADDGTIEAAGRLVWAIKILIYDLLADDGAAMAQRLTAGAGTNLTDAQLAALTGEPADISFGDHQTWRHNLRRLQETWLNDLPDEAPQYRANPDLLYSGRLPLAQTDESPSSEGTATPAQDKPADDDLFDEDDGDDLLGDEDDLLGGADDEESDQEDDLFGDDDDLLGDSGQDEPDQPTGDPAEQEPAKAQQQLDALRLSLGESGGWFLDEANFAVRYRPIGHADPFLRAWLDVTSSPPSSTDASAMQAVFGTLRRDKAPGWCVRCHSVDAVDDGQSTGFRVNWHGARPALGQRPFTTFAHRPHFNFQQFRDCTACHSVRTIDSAAVQDWKRTYAGTNAGSFLASFDSMSLTQCAGCHTPNGVGDGCLTCHNYHVGSFTQPLTPPDLGAMARVADGSKRSSRRTVSGADAMGSGRRP